ncbi:hypothetical protein [Desulfotalea psychrophila]|uniref:hypothetical protein n=1 Tax=Desulfotalea psychrophila TaxID=84980 RepID=UPI000318B8B4|nr:hypothetical protein [Desulfotalea psychrophila]
MNHTDKVVIFGAWDIDIDTDNSMILCETWQFNKKGRKNCGYKQSLEHVLLIDNEGYQLKTFPMKHAKTSNGSSKISDFTPHLADKNLRKKGSGWWAY